MKLVSSLARLLTVLSVSLLSLAAHSQAPVPGVLYRLTTQWLGDGRSLAADEGGSKQIRLVDSNQRTAQYWYVMQQPNGFYQLINFRFPGEVIDIVNDGKYNNRITLAPQGNYSGQFWKLTPNSNGFFYRLTSLWLGEGKSLDVLNDGNNRELLVNETGAYSGQFWKLTPVAENEKRMAQEIEAGEYDAQQVAPQALPQAKQYTVGIDCMGYSTLTNTETNDMITVTFVDVSGFSVGSKSVQINNCNADTSIDFSGSNLMAIQISTSGSDAFWMDRVWMTEDGKDIGRWGKNEGDGYCLSKDPADTNGGFKNFLGTRGCQECMRFDWTTKQVTPCLTVSGGR